MNTPGVRIMRPLLVFGYDDVPHGHAEVAFEGARVPLANIILVGGRVGVQSRLYAGCT